MKASQKFCHDCHQAYAHQDSLGYPVKEARLNYSAPIVAITAGTPNTSNTQDTTEALTPGQESVAIPVGDATRGKGAFQTCHACHAIGPNATNKVGPVLTNVIGRTAGTYPHYAYSRSLKKAGEGGLVWTDEAVFEWLNGPSAFLKKHLEDDGASSKMLLTLDDPQMRSDIIAYLKTFSEGAQ